VNGTAASAVAGLSIVLFGVLLLLEEQGSINIAGGWLMAGLTACAGISLVASGFAARSD
jgi:uncharacterized membrane protein